MGWGGGCTDLEYSDSAKYLGITLDSELNFAKHMREKANKAKRLLCMAEAMIGQLWGPSPRATWWSYMAIVCPKVTYGAVVLVNKASRYIQALNRVQRLAFLAFLTFATQHPLQGWKHSWM